MVIPFKSITRQAIFLFLFFLLYEQGLAQAVNELSSPRKQVIFFDLPGQSINQGLIEFALQSKLNIILDADLAGSLRSRPIVGPYEPEKALGLLLSGTDLYFDIIEGKDYIVVRQKNRPELAESAATQTTAILDDNIEEMLVSAVRYPFRYNTISHSHIYGNLSAFDSARFIHILPQTLVRDQGPEDLIDLLKYSSSITPGDGLADTNDDFYIRGFPRFGIYADGVRMSENTGVKQVKENVEKVEILKGPSTLFYGQAEPGGIVNVVSKRPKEKPHYQFEWTLGANGQKSHSIDFTGKLLPKNESWLYRLVGVKEERDVFRDTRDLTRDFWASSLQWRSSENTIFDLQYQYHSVEQRRDQGTLILIRGLGAPYLISNELILKEGSDRFSTQYNSIKMELKHFLSSQWSLSSQIFYSDEDRQGIRGNNNAILTSNILVSDTSRLPGALTVVPTEEGILVTQGEETIELEDVGVIGSDAFSLHDEQSVENLGSAKILISGVQNLFSLNHNIRAGAEFYRSETKDEFVVEEREDAFLLTLQVHRDDRSIGHTYVSSANPNGANGQLIPRSQDLRYDDFGIFFIDSIELSEKLNLSLGGRFTSIYSEYLSAENERIELDLDNKFSHELGLRYAPIEDIGLYLNYSESLRGNYLFDDIGTTLSAPEESKQIEIGFKGLLFNGRLATTFALYQIEKEGVIGVSFENGLRYANAIGEQRSKGGDLDFTYQISRSFDLIGSFSHVDTESLNGEVPEKLPMVADKSASLLVSYHYEQGARSSVDFNIGASYVGEREGHKVDLIQNKLDDYYTLDCGLNYRLRNYQVKTQIKNITNEDYIMSSEGLIRENKGQSRSYSLSFLVEF